MGLFGFVGKLLGGAVKVAANIATGNPLGAIKAGVGTFSSLLGSKGPPGTAGATKIAILGRLPVTIARGNTTAQGTSGFAGPVQRRLSPVLPGGAIATRSGPVPQSGATPPRTFGGSSARKKRRSSGTSSSRKRSKRRSSARRLKFGSPAWRKKYMKKGKRRRSKSR